MYGLRYLRGAGVDSVREQEKLEARKMPENAAESHTSGARFVGTLFECKCFMFLKELYFQANVIVR